METKEKLVKVWRPSVGDSKPPQHPGKGGHICYECEKEKYDKKPYLPNVHGTLEDWLELLSVYGESKGLEEWWGEVNGINFPNDVMVKLRHRYCMAVYREELSKKREKFPGGPKGNIRGAVLEVLRDGRDVRGKQGVSNVSGVSASDKRVGDAA